MPNFITFCDKRTNEPNQIGNKIIQSVEKVISRKSPHRYVD